MIRNEDMIRVKTLLAEVEQKATEVKLYYVVCLFRSPVTKHIERRFGLFADCCEAEMFYKMLREVYEKKIPTKFLITSNVSFLSMQDHGLIGDTTTQDEVFIQDLIIEQQEQM